MKINILTILLLLVSVSLFAQKERRFIRHGNRYYNKAVENSDSVKVDSVNFANAETEYRKALEKKPNDFVSQFNIGDALFKQKKYAESALEFQQILDATSNKEDKSKAWFNYGNSMMGQQKFDESIDAYKNALRNNPKDLEAKYNLEFARKMKQQQEQQQQQNKDKNKDQNKDQQDKDQNKEDQNKDQNKDQQNKDQQNKDQNQQQQQSKISKQNAEQMLKALQNDEKDTQEKVKKAKAVKAQSNRPDKDW